MGDLQHVATFIVGNNSPTDARAPGAAIVVAFAKPDCLIERVYAPVPGGVDGPIDENQQVCLIRPRRRCLDDDGSRRGRGVAGSIGCRVGQLIGSDGRANGASCSDSD